MSSTGSGSSGSRPPSRRRVGTYATFLEAMRAHVQVAEIPDGPLARSRPLSELNVDDPGENWALALLSGWAAAADVLTFYQQRIADESYLATAVTPRAQLDLVRTTGQTITPGRVAEVTLAFKVALPPGSTDAVQVPAGVAAESVVPPSSAGGTGSGTVVFETATAIAARPEWNAMSLWRPPSTLPSFDPADPSDLVLPSGTGPLLPGDLLGVIGGASVEDPVVAALLRVDATSLDAQTGGTAVSTDAVGTSAGTPTALDAPETIAFQTKVRLLGVDAPDWLGLPIDTRRGYAWILGGISVAAPGAASALYRSGASSATKVVPVEPYTASTGLPTDDIRGIVALSDGSLLAATAAHGVLVATPAAIATALAPIARPAGAPAATPPPEPPPGVAPADVPAMWVDRSRGLGSKNISAVTVDRDGTVMVGTTEGGVYCSTDDGQSWSPISRGATLTHKLASGDFTSISLSVPAYPIVALAMGTVVPVPATPTKPTDDPKADAVAASVADSLSKVISTIPTVGGVLAPIAKAALTGLIGKAYAALRDAATQRQASAPDALAGQSDAAANLEKTAQGAAAVVEAATSAASTVADWLTSSPAPSIPEGIWQPIGAALSTSSAATKAITQATATCTGLVIEMPRAASDASIAPRVARLAAQADGFSAAESKLADTTTTIAGLAHDRGSEAMDDAAKSVAADLAATAAAAAEADAQSKLPPAPPQTDAVPSAAEIAAIVSTSTRIGVEAQAIAAAAQAITTALTTLSAALAQGGGAIIEPWGLGRPPDLSAAIGDAQRGAADAGTAAAATVAAAAKVQHSTAAAGEADAAADEATGAVQHFDPSAAAQAPLPPPPPAGDPRYFAATADSLHQSNDRGRTWLRVALPVGAGSIRGLAVDGPGATLLLGTETGLYSAPIAPLALDTDQVYPPSPWLPVATTWTPVATGEVVAMAFAHCGTGAVDYAQLVVSLKYQGLFVRVRSLGGPWTTRTAFAGADVTLVGALSSAAWSGSSWAVLPPPTAPMIACIGAGDLRVSLDGGASWAPLPLALTPRSNAALTAATPDAYGSWWYAQPFGGFDPDEWPAVSRADLEIDLSKTVSEAVPGAYLLLQSDAADHAIEVHRVTGAATNLRVGYGTTTRVTTLTLARKPSAFDARTTSCQLGSLLPAPLRAVPEASRDLLDPAAGSPAPEPQPPPDPAPTAPVLQPAPPAPAPVPGVPSIEVAAPAAAGADSSDAAAIVSAYPAAGADLARAIVDTGRRLGADPFVLANLIHFESGRTFSPSIKNPRSGATGLIQFMPSTAQHLGTTTDSLAAMTAVEQMTWVEKYLEPHRPLDTEQRVYMTVFYPAARDWPLTREFPPAVQAANPVRTPADYIKLVDDRARLPVSRSPTSAPPPTPAPQPLAPALPPDTAAAPATVDVAPPPILAAEPVPAWPTLYLAEPIPPLEPGRTLVVEGRSLRATIRQGELRRRSLADPNHNPILTDLPDPLYVVKPGSDTSAWILVDKRGTEYELVAASVVLGWSTSDDPTSAEIVTVPADVQRQPEYASSALRWAAIPLSAPLGRAYDVRTVRIYGNIARATQGSTFTDVALGSGEGSATGQTFALPTLFLAYEPTQDGAGASTLSVSVGGVAWRAVESLTAAGPDDTVFMEMHAADGTTSVRFGDGVNGARLPTGIDNVTATWRASSGEIGVVGPGALTRVLGRPLGVVSVTNPLASTAAEPPAAIAVAAADVLRSGSVGPRIVTPDDYLTSAMSYPGIAKAQRRQTSRGGERITRITVAREPTTTSRSVEDDQSFLTSLKSFLESRRLAGDRKTSTLVVDQARVVYFGFRARVWTAPGEDADSVVHAVGTTLQAAFGFDRRPIGAAVTLADLIEEIQAVPGVAGTYITALALLDGADDAAPDEAEQSVRADLPADPGAADDTAGVLLLIGSSRAVAIEVSP